MVKPDSGCTIKVGDGAGHLKDTVVSTSRKSQPVHGCLHQFLAAIIYGTILLKQFGVDLCVAMNVDTIFVTFGLDSARPHHTLAHSSAAFSPGLREQLVVAERANLYVKV